MASRDLQILIVVDVYRSVTEDEDDLKAELPDERDERKVLRLTKYGAPNLEPPPDTSPIDWPAIGQAVEKLAAEVRELRASRSNPTVIFVGGKGPLPIFIHLGYLLSKFGGKQVVLNQPPSGGKWEQFAMGAPEANEAPLFEAAEGLPATAVAGSGQLGIYVDTSGRDTPGEVFENFLEQEGEGVAGVVKLRRSSPLLVTPANISAIAQELVQFFSMAPSRFRKRSGLTIFFGGPTQVAFALGRALNPTVVGPNLWLTNHRQPKYERVYSLPFSASTEPALRRTAEDELARRDIRDAMIAGLDELKEKLTLEQLPADVLPEASRARFIERLKILKHVPKECDGFELRVLHGQYTLGTGLLEAFRKIPAAHHQDFAKLLFLHEMLHDFQDIRSTNYYDVGRAGVVLEQVDLAADAFAVRTLAKVELDDGGRNARAGARGIVRRLIDTALWGVEAFDRMEQGDRIERLPERRLRRYLIWYLQLARAQNVSDPSHIDAMLRPALTVELAPLAGRLDTTRYDKVVTHALPMTELFVGIDGHLVRQARRAGFDPASLVEDVRNYKRTEIERTMDILVDSHRPELVKWRT